jgi:peptidoglycan hydrolase-like protein with peptidoglycan-binding domain
MQAMRTLFAFRPWLACLGLLVLAMVWQPAHILAPALAQDGGAALQQAYIRGIQEALAAHGFRPGPPTGELDAATRAAIRAYQQQAGLPVDGKPTAALLDHIKFAEPQVMASGNSQSQSPQPPQAPRTQKPPPPPAQPPAPPAKPEAAAPKPPLPPSDTPPPSVTSPPSDTKPDPMVSDIQRRLAERGYDPGPANGLRGDQARNAAREFQRDAGLAETGVLNQSLLDALKAEGAVDAPAAPTNRPPPLKFSNDVPPQPAPAPEPAETAKPQPVPAPAPKPSPPPPTPAEPPPAPRAEAPDEQRARERGAEAGELEIFLAWGSSHDLDVFVHCPSGETVTATVLEACGGRLDLDTNGSGNAVVPDPVEHVVFPNPEKGAYRIGVANCEQTGQPERFRLWVVYRGKTIAQHDGMSAIDRAWRTPNCGSPLSYLRFTLPE